LVRNAEDCVREGFTFILNGCGPWTVVPWTFCIFI
jgi:hypothetical protein